MPEKRIVLLTLWLAIPGLTQGSDFPYDAYISSEQADVIAGPGHRFYATERLPRGAKVEIHKEEPSGWLAIRPPDGSFSWVPAEFVERMDDETMGRVNEPTGAWIGTSVEHVGEHRQQVTLKAGEVVQILSEKSVAAKNSGGTWLKIAPPAGEFRWVHLRDVSRQKPEDPKPQPPSAAEPEVAEEPRVPEEKPARVDRLVEPAQFRGTPSVSAPRSLSPDGFVPRKRRSDEQVPVPTAAPTRSPATPIAARPRIDADARIASTLPARPAPAVGSLSSDEITRQLDQIEIDLSTMVSQDRAQWNLAALKQRVETLVAAGVDPVARGRARLVLDKVNQFEETFDARSVSPSSRSVSTQPLPSSTSALADPRYDAQGWLKPVISRKSDKPAAPFAVVDAEGKPVCFISPSPGMNLNRYLNKQVGLYGRRGYLEELKKPHVLAERIVEIDSHLR